MKSGQEYVLQMDILDILFEDEFFIIVNKSSGVNYASKTNGKGKSLFDLTLSYLKRKYKNQQGFCNGTADQRLICHKNTPFLWKL